MSDESQSLKKDGRRAYEHTLKIQLVDERAGQEPLVQVIGRGSRSEVATRLSIPLTAEQYERLQQMVLGNLAIAVPLLLMRALDELERENKTLKISVRRMREE